MNIVGWVLMALGALFLGIGIWMLATAYMSTSWPVVEGQVVESKVVTRIGQAGSTTQRHLEYSVEVVYQYEVDQNTHQASRYSLGDGNTVVGGYNDKSEARAWLKNSPFQQGHAVTVYVNPNDPNDTVLSAGINWGTFIPVILGILLLVLGYFVRLIVPQPKGIN